MTLVFGFNEIVMQEGDHIKNNMFARKQLAKTLGIEESKLASALQKKMILEKAGEAGISLSLDSTDAAFEEAAKKKINSDYTPFSLFAKVLIANELEKAANESTQ